MRDKVVVITGASGGIGAAVARIVGREGGRPVLAARRERELLEAEHFDFRIESKSRDDDFSALVAILAQVRQRLRSTS